MRKITIDLNSINNLAYFENTIRQGENLATEIEFVLNSEFTGYKYLMILQLNSKTPVTTPELLPVDGKVSYIVTNAVTNETGTLRVELHAYNDADALIKTAFINLKVAQSISGTTEVMPESYVPWYIAAVEQATIATNKAAEAAEVVVDVKAQINDLDVQPSNTTHNQIDATTPPSAYITFIDDDGELAVWDKLKPISEEKNIPFVIALYKNSPLTQEQCLFLQNTLKWEIASHAYSHEPLVNFTGKNLDDELTASKRTLRAKGYDIRNIVYPYGQENNEVRNIASKYFNCGVKASPETIDGTNTQPVESYKLSRVPLGSFTDDGKNTLEYYKSKVDIAVTKGNWLIFMTHCNNVAHDATQQQYLRDLIDYIATVGAKVVTLEEGNRLYGNRISLKRFNSDNSINAQLVVTNDGKIFMDGYNEYPTKYSRTKLGISGLITNYPKGQITVTDYFSADNSGFPGNKSGVAVTYRIDKNYGWDGNAFQVWYPYDSNRIFKRRWDTTTNNWGAFEELATVSYVDSKNIVILMPQNSYTAESPITAFPSGKITKFTVNVTGGTGFPDNYAGIVTTYRLQGNGFDRQTFEKHNSNSVWSRYVVSSTGAWSAWEKISAV